MCGFAGIVAWDQGHRLSHSVLEKMSARLAHRGPDGAGLRLNHDEEVRHDRPQVGLVHRRLAILDPDPRSDQPFTDGQGRWLVFNGEIYNFRELRGTLQKLDSSYQWKTTGDTEVLLRAFAQWGPACVKHLNGMFAFAVWDDRNRSLFMARDRMGQKPLFWAMEPRAAGMNASTGAPMAIAFASELGALHAVPWFNALTNYGALADYLCWGYIPSPATIYDSVYKLAPAETLTISFEKGLQTDEYFNPNLPEEDAADINETTAITRTRKLVEQAVARQLVSDVPVGCFLSGGIDSSIIALAMRQAVPKDQPVYTFSIGFGDRKYDETPFAAEVARHLGTTHQEFIVSPNVADDLPKLAAVFGEPFADSSALPTHYLSRQTRQSVKVALSGDGGDELFGGYDRYRAMAFTERWAGMLGGPVRSVVSKLPGTHPKAFTTRLKRMLAGVDLPPPARYASYQRLFDARQLQKLISAAFLEQTNLSAQWLVLEFDRWTAGRDVVQTALAVDRSTYLPHDLLTKLDRASMLHALEVRSPFMDPDLVRFAAGLNAKMLLDGGPKRLLRKAFSSDLPRRVFSRPKMGFAVPMGHWLRGPLRSLLHDALFAQQSFCSTHFARPAVERMIEQHEHKEVDHSQRLYALLMLELWHTGSTDAG